MIDDFQKKMMKDNLLRRTTSCLEFRGLPLTLVVLNPVNNEKQRKTTGSSFLTYLT